MMKKKIIGHRVQIGNVPAPSVPPPQPARKGAVTVAAWERWKLDGGALVIYPPKKGGELAGMMTVYIAPQPPPTTVAASLDPDVARSSALARRKS